MNRRTAFIGAAAALALGVLCALPSVASPFVQSLALTCLMYVGLAVSWTIFSGPTRYLCLATSSFFGLGAYFCVWFTESLPWWVVIVGGALTATLFAVVLGLIVLRLRGAYFAVITFGTSELVKHCLVLFEKAHAGSVGRVVTPPADESTVYLTVLALAVAAFVARVWIGRRLLGRQGTAIGMDEERISAIGVDPMWVKLKLLCISAAFAGAIGAAMAVRWTYVEPATVFNPFISFQTVLIAMVGGPASLWGSAVSAVIFSLLSEFLRLTLPNLYLILLGVLLIVAVLYLPSGIGGLRLRRRTRGAGLVAGEAPA